MSSARSGKTAPGSTYSGKHDKRSQDQTTPSLCLNPLSIPVQTAKAVIGIYTIPPSSSGTLRKDRRKNRRETLRKSRGGRVNLPPSRIYNTTPV